MLLPQITEMYKENKKGSQTSQPQIFIKTEREMHSHFWRSFSPNQQKGWRGKKKFEFC